MKGYTGYKFGEPKPYDPFSGGGSTFTGAKPPEWLSELSSFASPEEWQTQGTAFIQNPQMLEKRAQLAQLGRQSLFDIAAMGDPTQAGREQGELNRLKVATEKMRLQSQIALQPQMNAIRGSIMGRMAGSLGLNLPQATQPYSSGSGYTPSWMQSYKTPQFPQLSFQQNQFPRF